MHDAGAVHHHVDPTEGAERLPEEALDGRPVRHVRPNREGVSVAGLDLGHRLFSLGGIAGVAEDDREAVASQPQGHRAADAARGAGDDGNLCLCVSHRCPPE